MTLQQKLSLQREVVDQYQRALQATREKLQECYDRQGDYVDSSTEGLIAKMTLLEERLRLQNQAVQEYENIREQENK